MESGEKMEREEGFLNKSVEGGDGPLEEATGARVQGEATNARAG
jgi:hypothetical protein